MESRTVMALVFIRLQQHSLTNSLQAGQSVRGTGQTSSNTYKHRNSCFIRGYSPWWICTSSPRTGTGPGSEKGQLGCLQTPHILNCLDFTFRAVLQRKFPPQDTVISKERKPVHFLTKFLFHRDFKKSHNPLHNRTYSQT